MTVTINLNIVQVATWIIIGLLAGFMASAIVRGRGAGTFGSILLGLIGAIVGGALLTIFRPVGLPAWLTAPIQVTLFDILVAFVGAVLVLLVVSLLYRRRL